MKRFFTHPVWPHLLFWGWNMLFIVFLVFGFAPLVLFEVLRAVREGWIPAGYLVVGVCLIAVPIACILIAALRLRAAPGRLFMLMYAVEAPLMVLLFSRLFGLNEITAVVGLLLGMAAIGLVTMLWRLLDFRMTERGRLPAAVQWAGMVALALVGAYVSAVLVFYLPIVAGGILQLIGQLLRALVEGVNSGSPRIALDMLSGMMFAVLWFVMLIATGTLFLLLPIALPAIVLHQVRAAFGHARARLGIAWTAGLALVLGVTSGVAFVMLNRQPQHAAFAALKTPPASVTQARALAQNEANLKHGLLNAYLAAQRYPSAMGDVRHIYWGYHDGVGLSSENAFAVQRAFDRLLQPLLYEPTSNTLREPAEVGEWIRDNRAQTLLSEDSQQAAQLYARVFDKDINSGERETVVAAVRSTWDRNRATEAWQAVDDREVLLAEQALTVTERDGFADVELYEVYENVTARREEAVYYFSMPESSVITGVWLGNSADRTQRFDFRVSPRGAAQQLYKEQVVANTDPALVEQIGPRQYRLRVFPIEPPEVQWSQRGRGAFSQPDRGITKRPLHLWLTWRVLQTGSGEQASYALPRLAEKRNVYWTDASKRTVNGIARASADDAWLPSVISAKAAVPATVKRVDFPNGWSVVATPVDTLGLNTRLSGEQRLAVVIDRSYSMAARAGAVQRALQTLRDAGIAANKVDVYLTAPEYLGEAPSRTTLDKLAAASLVYFGGQDPADLLIQFAAIKAGSKYDAVLVLTDDSGFELSVADKPVPTPDSPVWMVHLDGALPLGYSDQTLAAVQASGGGAATSIDEVLQRIAARQLAATKPGHIGDVTDGLYWEVLPTTEAGGVVSSGLAQDHPFATVAARRLIVAELQRNRGRLNETTMMDELHTLAKRYGIVTPYSSMIVLVTSEQQRRLDELEKQGDRFNRETEKVGETPVVTAVPEPHEWALLAMGALLLIVYLRRRGTPQAAL